MFVKLFLVFSSADNISKLGPRVTHKYNSEGGYLLTFRKERILKTVLG